MIKLLLLYSYILIVSVVLAFLDSTVGRSDSESLSESIEQGECLNKLEDCIVSYKQQKCYLLLYMLQKFASSNQNHCHTIAIESWSSR